MRIRGLITAAAAGLVLMATVAAAEDFGDVSASASAMYSGNTYHGYAEIRVALANHSPGKAHVVELVFPDASWNSGNCLGRVSRTVKLEPNSRETALLLQPPLPSNGNGEIRVSVDGRHEGEIRAPNANNHCNYNSSGRQTPTIFASRSLNLDDVERLFHADHGAYTAAMAVGPPNATGTGYQPSAWIPDTRHYGVTNWLELDYATPQTVNEIELYETRSPSPHSSTGTVELLDASGSVITTIHMSAGTRRTGSPGWITTYSMPTSTVAVKTVRLNFAKTPPANIAIDAVQISGPSGSQWASDARASSDASASGLPSYSSGGPMMEQAECLRAESAVSDWSENWLAYTPFDAVVLNVADLGAMSPAVVTAIGDYLQAGGNVLLAGTWDLPAEWHSVKKTQLHNAMEYEVGFGRCFTAAQENLALTDPQLAGKLLDTVRDTARYWRALPDDGPAANSEIPIVANMKIPTRGLVMVMLGFIILIGPVNIIYLNRIKRRTWMLWTIPAISLVTTLLVFVYTLLREGITPDTRITGLTFIDQASHHATTIGGSAFYCPLTPSGGLNFDYETEATPLVSTEYGRGQGTSREVDWSQSQHFQRGWVSARVPAFFHLRKSETRRERVQIVNANGKLQVINGLGMPIETIWFADADRNIFFAKNVAAGQQANLLAAKLPSEAVASGAMGLLREVSFAGHTAPLADHAARFLTANSYIAVLEGNPFIENALGSAASPKRTKSSAVVFGILETPRAP